MPRFRSERVKASDRAYREAHREEANARTRAWAAANPEKRRAMERSYRQRNKDKIRESKREWRKANRDKQRAASARWRINRRLSLDSYRELFERQGGLCAICKSSSPRRTNSTRLAIDHCHRSGVVRGLLCHPCNALIGLAGDNCTTLAAAISYLGGK